MTGAETLDVARDAIWTIVVVSSPLMVIGLVVGVVVSLFQALTQIQEQTLIILPLHRTAYQVDLSSMSALGVLMVHEIVIGIVLGATARVTLSALAVAGSVIAQQLGLGFVSAVDPTQGQQGLLIGNFLTILGLTLLFATDSHHLVIAALSESYRIFSPGELVPSGDVAALATRAFATAFKIGM